MLPTPNHLLQTLSKLITIALFVALLSAAIVPLFDAVAAPLFAISPDLGAATSYSVLGGQTVTNTGLTTMPGDLGVSPGSAVTGFPPGIVGPPGAIHAGDAQAAAAQSDNAAAFTFLDQTCDTTYPGVKDLVGETLVPGTYCADAFRLSGTLSLSGSGVWIFKSASDLIVSGAATVVGGDPCNVWWREVSSATLGANTALIGNILASTSISLETGARLNGRALAQTGSVTLDSNTITGPICALQATNTPVPSATNTPVPGATNTPVPSATNTPLPGATNTPVPGATNTPLPGATNTPVPGATNTPVPGATNTPVPGVTNTPLPEATSTSVPGATNTPLPEATSTPMPEATSTPVPGATSTLVPSEGKIPPPTPASLPPSGGAPSSPWTAVLIALGIGVMALGLGVGARRRVR
ncbi:MAG: DUF3494 domain-containing protein [Ardenticatenales bacterium]|nr:DUF3494 domain-containing protein [Ardenticatenales bacterium]